MLGDVIVWLVLGGLAGAVGASRLVHARGRARLAQLIEDTRTSKVKDLRPGALVEVEGTVRALDGRPLLEAPVSRTPCVYAHLLIEEQVSKRTGHGKNRRTRTVWVTRVSKVERVPFVLHDGTGGVEVDLERAEVGLKADEAGGSGFLSDPTPAFQAALQRYGVASAGLVFNNTLRWRETFLRPGDPLYALGTYDGRRVTRGSHGVLVVSDRGQAGTHALVSGEARTARLVGLGLVVLGVGLALLGLFQGLHHR